MVNVCITGNLALVAGLIAKKHPDCSIQIEWREGTDEREWLITALDGKNEHPYVVDDETGTSAPLTDEEKARVSRGEAIIT